MAAIARDRRNLQNKQRWPPAQAIFAHTHASVHVAALITRVNWWLGCGQLTLLDRSLSTTGAGRDCRPAAERRSRSRYASSPEERRPAGAVEENQKGSLICILRRRRSLLSAAVPAWDDRSRSTSSTTAAAR